MAERSPSLRTFSVRPLQLCRELYNTRDTLLPSSERMSWNLWVCAKPSNHCQLRLVLLPVTREGIVLHVRLRMSCFWQSQPDILQVQYGTSFLWLILCLHNRMVVLMALHTQHTTYRSGNLQFHRIYILISNLGSDLVKTRISQSPLTYSRIIGPVVVGLLNFSHPMRRAVRGPFPAVDDHCLSFNGKEYE